MQADVERLLARLLTDRQLREQFVADPAGIAIQEGLSAVEAGMLAQMPMLDLRTAGRSYERKRNVIRKGTCKRKKSCFCFLVMAVKQLYFIGGLRGGLSNRGLWDNWRANGRAGNG